MWPAVTIQAGDQQEVDCLLRALGRAGAAPIAQAGFCVDVGGLPLGKTLKAVHECLKANGIDSVSVILSDGKKYVLSGSEPTL